MTQVDRHIQDRTGHATHQLALGGGVRLEMKAANGSHLGRERFVFLHEFNRAYRGGETISAKGFREIAACIAQSSGHDFDRPFYRELIEYHEYLQIPARRFVQRPKR
jgi:hypothetical protein